ncbi:DsbE family thiol:disulfide interchange protein [Marinimicrobium sp. ABcell2]|uniref:DsbE family thiol:disulfide interchange protein n=1 Tax=Marinimicrobium sp. ABcell2 TaxID=3069751 RepID=UPI0027B4EA98|nr:DsbE family thiol:disulfide interchange protein [Marinimicrobium sp. ABcell2]MDQ2077843.1 DsbE family thiol:disulfide interchange protein [Marinimicrobium sp. ABcell2]
MNRLKLFLPLAVFGVLAVLFWRGLSLDPHAMPSARLEQPVPAFELRTIRDEEGRITPEVFLEHDYSLLNIWATWCAACRVEHPFFVELVEREGVPIYGINYKDDVAAAARWLEELHDPYVLSVVDQDGRLGLDLGVFGAPETYLIDGRGIIRHRHVGVVNWEIWERDFRPLIERIKEGG